MSSTNKTDRHDITEILLKVALNIINLNQTIFSNARKCWKMNVVSLYDQTHNNLQLKTCLFQRCCVMDWFIVNTNLRF